MKQEQLLDAAVSLSAAHCGDLVVCVCARVCVFVCGCAAGVKDELLAMRRVLSSELLTNISPSLKKVMVLTAPRCSLYSWTAFPARMSHCGIAQRQIGRARHAEEIRQLSSPSVGGSFSLEQALGLVES